MSFCKKYYRIFLNFKINLILRLYNARFKKKKSLILMETLLKLLTILWKMKRKSRTVILRSALSKLWRMSPKPSSGDPSKQKTLTL